MATIHVSGGGTALRNAIANCADGDEIIVGDGIYTGNNYVAPSRKRFSVSSENGHENCIVKFCIAYNGVDGATGDIYISEITFDSIPSTNSLSFRFCKLEHCVVENTTQEYHLFGNQSLLVSCLCRNSKATSGRLVRTSTCINCTFTNNIIANGTLNYSNSTFRNCLFAGNTKTAGGEPLTNYGSTASNPNCMAGGLNLVDADSRPVPGSPAYGGGSSSYLQTATDLDGIPWLNPPSIGCYEYVWKDKSMPTRIVPMGVS